MGKESGMASNKVLTIKSDNIDELADEYDGRFLVGKVNVDEENDLVSRFNIMNIPTLIAYKKGSPVEKVIGARSKADLKNILDKHI